MSGADARPSPAPTHGDRVDVIVVGARVAGAATGLLLARQGFEVLIVDRAELPSDTLSTHTIARTGVVQLSRWGLLDKVLATGAPPIRDVVFQTAAEATRRRVRDRHGVDLLVAPRRHILDDVVLQAAVAAGARVRTGVDVGSVLHDRAGRVVGVQGAHDGKPFTAHAHFVVGADGLRSRVARAVGAPVTERRPDGGATFYAYFRGHWPAMEYHLGEQRLAGIFPTHHREACVWACVPAATAKDVRRRAGSLDRTLDGLIDLVDPALGRRIQEAERRSTARGATGLPNQIRRPYGPGWALVGDAGFHRDPITGHGISDAFRDAELLAVWLGRALRGDIGERDALSRFHRHRDALLREVFELTVALAAFPPLGRFVELQRELSRAIDRQAAQLAALPSIDAPHAGAALPAAS